MKYEAKFVDYVDKTDTDGYNVWDWDSAFGNKNITSISGVGPIGYINFTDSWNACKNLGTGYHMITNREWMTIARNAELQNSNWNTSIAGSGSMFRGHSDGTPFKALSVTNVNDFYNGAGQSYPSIERRVLNLSNGELIWDLGGNVWEWTDLMENGGVIASGNSCGGNGYYSFYNNDGNSACSWMNGFAKTSAGDPRYEVGPLGNFNANNGIGRIYSSTSPSRVLLRGGCWNYGASAGAVALNLDDGPSNSGTYHGFRCSYAP